MFIGDGTSVKICCDENFGNKYLHVTARKGFLIDVLCCNIVLGVLI